MILLGITGSVAAILASKLAEALKKVDSRVEVIVTKSALSFVDMPKLKGIVDRVYTDEDEWCWGEEKRLTWQKNDPVLHIELRNRATVLVIAPATANTIAKMCNGVCDNLLTSVFLAWDRKKPVLIAPAMNSLMWFHPITGENLSLLRHYGCIVVPPQSKKLACGDEGVGAMAEISDIARSVLWSYSDKWRFPLAVCNGVPVNPHPGAFGYVRREHRHTGVDLYTEDNAVVYSVEPGVVVGIEHFTGEQDGSPWWNNTDCMLVEGASGVVCYGEIETAHKVGDSVSYHKPIANVRRVIKVGRERPDIPGHSPSMLHIELYPNGTRHASIGFEPFLRDPTPFLLTAYGRPNKKELVYDGYKPSSH